MDLSELAGEYSEVGAWWDTGGKTGALEGTVVVEPVAGGLEFRYGDEDTQTAEPLARGVRHTILKGSTSSGVLLVGEHCLILEYEASVNGMVEKNTDTWSVVEGVVRRSGVIRQPNRTIWFEAEMSRR